MKRLTILSGVTRTLTHQFMMGSPVEFTRTGSNAVSSELEVAAKCFRAGDRLGLCVSSSECPPQYVPGICPQVTAVSEGSMTVAGVSLEEGSSGTLHKLPGLRGMWLSLVMTPERGDAWLTSPIVTGAGSNLIVVCGTDCVKVGDRVSAMGVLSETVVQAVRHFTEDDGSEMMVLTVGSAAIKSVDTRNHRVLTVQPPAEITVLGPRAKTSAGSGACGGLQLVVSRDVSSRVSRWGKGQVGDWKLLLNNGWSQQTPWTSHLLQAGQLHVR